MVLTWNLAPMRSVTFLGSSSNAGKTWMSAGSETALRPPPNSAEAVSVVSPTIKPWTEKPSAWPLSSAAFFLSARTSPPAAGDRETSTKRMSSPEMASPRLSFSDTRAETARPRCTLRAEMTSTACTPETWTRATEREKGTILAIESPILVKLTRVLLRAQAEILDDDLHVSVSRRRPRRRHTNGAIAGIVSGRNDSRSAVGQLEEAGAADDLGVLPIFGMVEDVDDVGIHAGVFHQLQFKFILDSSIT